MKRNRRKNATRRSSFSRRLLVFGACYISLLLGAILGYRGAPKYVVENETTIREVKPSHVGSSLVEADTLENPVSEKDVTVNPYSGKPEVDYSAKGEPLFVPANSGAPKTFLNWNAITDETSDQFRLRMEAESYDSNDFGVIGNRYAVAVKPYYGKVGDYIDVVQVDDSVIHCVIVDIKGDENAADGDISNYVHYDGSIVEFAVNYYSWYTQETMPSVYDFHPEWNQNIKAIYNVGNYWNE